MDEHVILVALQVTAPSRRAAHEYVEQILPSPNEGEAKHAASHLGCWWVAEDDRRDGSDNDSAVFVSPGHQTEAYAVLSASGEHGGQISDEWIAEVQARRQASRV